MPDPFTRSNRRSLKRRGRSVTLVNQDATTDANGDIVRDEYRDPEWQDPIRTDTVAELIYRNTPQFQKRADGVGSDIDVIGWLLDDAPVTTGPDEATKATRIEDGATTIVVRDVWDEQNGQVRVAGEKE